MPKELHKADTSTLMLVGAAEWWSVGFSRHAASVALTALLDMPCPYLPKGTYDE